MTTRVESTRAHEHFSGFTISITILQTAHRTSKALEHTYEGAI